MDERLSLSENLNNLSVKMGDEGLVYLASKISEIKED